MINAFNFLSFFRIQHQATEEGNKPKEERVFITWMVVIKYLKSSGDDLLLETSSSDLGDHIF